MASRNMTTRKPVPESEYVDPDKEIVGYYAKNSDTLRFSAEFASIWSVGEGGNIPVDDPDFRYNQNINKYICKIGIGRVAADDCFIGMIAVDKNAKKYLDVSKNYSAIIHRPHIASNHNHQNTRIPTQNVNNGSNHVKNNSDNRPPERYPGQETLYISKEKILLSKLEKEVGSDRYRELEKESDKKHAKLIKSYRRITPEHIKHLDWDRCCEELHK